MSDTVPNTNDVGMLKLFQAMLRLHISINSTTFIIYNNNDSRTADKIKKNKCMNDEIAALQAKIDQISTLAATIPVVTAPIIVTVLKAPPLCFAVSDNETSPTRMEPILSLTNITVLDSQQPLGTMIEVPVRTSASSSDITPSFKSGHISEVVPTVDGPSMDADERNHKVLVSFNDFNDQYTSSTPQVEYPNPIIIEDNSSDNKYACFSGDCDATSYSDSGTVHTPMAMVLVY